MSTQILSWYTLYWYDYAILSGCGLVCILCIYQIYEKLSK